MSKVSSTTVKAEVLTLAQIDEKKYQFSIPCYQRPYVWPDEDVLKLLNDINAARLAREPHYFIGTILTSVEQRANGDQVYELIDGQQRTTTLMLLAVAFRRAKSNVKLAKMASYKEQPRLQFAIREPVQHLLGSLAGLEKYTFPGHEVIEENPYLSRMYAALQVLDQQLNALSPEELMDLGDYIFYKVQWVNNIVPHQMDLNRLFSTMNTAGVQLEQTDILKSKLLKQIKTEKPLFDAIWVACEHLENYFERNVRKVFPNAPWNDILPDQLDVFNANLFTKEQNGEHRANGLSIREIFEQAGHCETSEPENESDFETYDLDDETVYCRPIISFPLLLIHAYRIHLAQQNAPDIEPRLHADKLIEIFAPLINSDETKVKAFIKLLWQVRYQFDRWIVKWVQRDDSVEEQLRLTYIIRSKSGGNWYINRKEKELTDLVMLQSVRNFTGERSAQYWITPFIGGLINKKITEKDQALQWLEQIDNELSLAADGETQKTASFKQVCGEAPMTINWLKQAKYFSTSRGTAFEHYWFQKLEYLLWKSEENLNDLKFKKYRITTKNSVEHVFPQHEEHDQALEPDILNAFGNLVLLSPSENSSYSHQAVKKKKVDFEAKPHYDSLKLKSIFQLMGNNEWNSDLIGQHQRQMIGVLQQHYNKTF